VINYFENIERRCWFLLAMSYLIFGCLWLLNGYITYRIILSFTRDGWQFMEGIIIAMSFVVTIPALLFSFLSIRMLMNKNSKKNYFPLIIGINGVIVGIILYSATIWWVFIITLNLLLVLSYFICKNRRLDIKSNHIKSASETSEKLETYTKRDFSIVILFQILGLILLLIVALSLIFPVSDKESLFIQKNILAFVFSVLFLFHLVLSFAFYNKKYWALNLKYIESYISLGLAILIFFSAMITEGVSLSRSFIFLFFLFVLLIILLIYLNRLYKKIKF